MSDVMRILSLGAGVQSSALLLLSEIGRLPRLDFAVFSDTQCEPADVYEWLDRLESMTTIPIIRTTGGSLYEDQINAAAVGGESNHMPYFVASPDGGSAILNRQCTRTYKIDPVRRAIRELMGLTKGQRVKGRVEQWIGISTDEAQRIKPPQEKWIDGRWPLCFDLRWSRAQCKEFLLEQCGEVPPKSSCIICPFHSDAEWRRLRDSPEWPRVVAFDTAIRAKGNNVCGAKSLAYLHRTLRPIDDVEFLGDGQRDLWGNECFGMCGV